MSNLCFDVSNHSYFSAGERLPSVTQIISHFEANFDFVNPGVLQNACNYGTAVHETIRLYEENRLEEANLSEGLKNPLNAWKEFKKTNKTELIKKYSVKLQSQKYGFAGWPDAVCSINGRKVLIDFKTRTCDKLKDELQTAAYKLLIEENFLEHIDKRAILQIKQDGKYKMTYLTDFSYRPFLWLLEIYRGDAKNLVKYRQWAKKYK